MDRTYAGEKHEHEGLGAPTKSSELNQIKKELDETLKILDGLISQLTNQLSEVMSPPLAGTDDTKGDTKYRSKLCQDLDSHNLGIKDQCKRLLRIMERLEL